MATTTDTSTTAQAPGVTWLTLRINRREYRFQVDARVTLLDALRESSHYLKVRERESYEFALVSVATCIELAGPDDRVRAARQRLSDLRGHAAGSRNHDN